MTHKVKNEFPLKSRKTSFNWDHKKVEEWIYLSLSVSYRPFEQIKWNEMTDICMISIRLDKKRQDQRCMRFVEC